VALETYVNHKIINGHCDCMFMVVCLMFYPRGFASQNQIHPTTKLY